MECQKHLFSLNPDIHYLNCAYKAPLMKSAENAAIQAIQRERNPAEITIDHFFSTAREVKELYGKIINAEAGQIAVIPSSTYGFSSVLNNTIAKNQGHAIIVKEAFPSGYYTLERWCKENNNSLLTIDPNVNSEHYAKEWNEKILANINKLTSVALVPTVHWMTGMKFDLQAIGEKCKQHDVRLIVDGTQSVGALPIDVKKYNISALICATYKWLFGPYSMGFLYINEEFNNGTPLEESWMNRSNAENFRALTDYSDQYTRGAGRFNVGQTSNFILLPIVKAALQQINTWQVENIQNYCGNLIQPLKRYLSSIGIHLEEDRYFANHLFSIPLTKDINEDRLHAALKKENLVLSVRGEHLRVSANVFNDANDINALIRALGIAREEQSS